MKRKKIALLTVLMLGMLVCTIPKVASAQPPPPPGKPTQTPVDGGLGLLAAAGGAYAVKKLRDRQKG